MDKVFIDSDVILDYLIQRDPFTMSAAKIISLSERKKINACTTGLVFANCYYVLRKFAPHKKVVDKLLQLSRWVEIIGLPGTAVLSGLQSDFSDFEDALQYFSSVESKVKIIVTRNVKDYKNSELAIMTPDLFLLHNIAKL